MRCWRSLTLALAFMAIAAGPAAEDSTPKAFGTGRAYQTLGKLPVLHTGRVKPFDTFAREEVKQLFGRETIKVLDASNGNQVVETWGSVAATFDWSVRPEVWDDTPFLLVEYIPLKRLVLADSIRARLGALAEKPGTSVADRDALKKLANDAEISTAKLHGFLDKSALSADDRKTVSTVASELSEEHKWLSPRQLEEATIATEAGKKQPFDTWFRSLVMKDRQAKANNTGEGKLTEVEKRANEVGTRLVHYQAIRDREMRSVEPMLVMPRPGNKEYLAFLAKTYETAQKTRSVAGLSPLELDGAKALDTYWNELPLEDRKTPGADPEFDKPFSSWLRESSAWVPLKVFLSTKPDDLAAAGFSADRVHAFLSAFKDLEKAEADAPGRVSEDKAQALVAAARGLGEAASPESYPSLAAVERETYFNETSPFYKAPWAYGLGVALLAVALGFQGFERKSFLGGFGRGVHVFGVLSLLTGILIEAFGFYLRVRISGWAPVTNMYETVIWVSAVSAVLGLVFELIYRNTYAGLAGAGTALLGTVLAANVSLLDPDIQMLQPVLRSNYWLAIHVLTEVSSYGAFLMAAMLGLIATGFYLTATYRRSPTFTELALPLVIGLPVLTVGLVGLAASYGELGPNWVLSHSLFLGSVGFTWIGEVVTIIALVALAGEVANRLTFHDESPLDASSKDAGEPRSATAAHAATTVQTVSIGEAEGQGTVSSVSKPTVAEMRAMAANAPQQPLGPRDQAMRATAARIKPLSNFIYRTMQVGVVLIAAGTILGGVWADYSWGRFWGWDPKEVWALITLLVYLIPLHGRFAGWFNTFALVVASVVCSMSVIMAWYGVNFVLGVGLHSYGFTEGGGQGVVWTTCLAVIALPFAAGWRRLLGSRSDTPTD